jgi:hypothetical protein
MTNQIEIDNQKFLAELQDLLSRYNADISFSVGSGSDTHGLYDEKMVISRRIDPTKVNRSNEVDIVEINGWTISAYDLKVNQNDN